MGQQLLAALPEWQVPLPGGVTTSNTDVLAICRNELGLCVLGVEAKVLEAFKTALDAREVAPLIYKVDSFDGSALYLAWCDGDSRFRNVLLPSALQFIVEPPKASS